MKIKFYLAFTALFFLCAQAMPQATAAKLTTFNFKMLTGGIILINGCINNEQDSLNFILDTGSGGISLDSETVAVLKLPIVPTNRILKGVSGPKKLHLPITKHCACPGCG